MKGSITIILFFSAGLILGIYGISLVTRPDLDPSLYALYFLMFLVGIGIGADTNIWKILGDLNFKVFMIPVVIIAGTLAGSAICSIFLKDITLPDSLAVGSGFGYYSLSSIIISEIRSETLGVTALLSNISREIFTLLFAPLLVKFFGRLAPIASGGATSMDTTLPVISKYSGREYAVLAVFSGILLTVLVPFIITAVYKASSLFN